MAIIVSKTYHETSLHGRIRRDIYIAGTTILYFSRGSQNVRSPLFFIFSCLLAVGFEIMLSLYNFRMQIHRGVLKFCQFDKISIRTCVFAYRQGRPWFEQSCRFAYA